MVKKIQRVAILGLGAVGASYAQQICKYAPDVILYGVVRDLETYWGSPILINDEPLRINYRTVGSLKSVHWI
jgi:ketopantoate reductase